LPNISGITYAKQQAYLLIQQKPDRRLTFQKCRLTPTRLETSAAEALPMQSNQTVFQAKIKRRASGTL